MSWTEETLKTIKRVNVVKRTLKDSFVDRSVAVDLMILAAVAHEHLLLIGPPGTAKSQLVNQFTQMIDARCFQYLLTRFTEPSELFGPLDLEAFHQGNYHIRTEGMMPQAQIAFLDEVFQGSSAILNTLLSLINERIFNNGPERQRSPLASVIGASNIMPDDPWLQAFADRFTLRLNIGPVPDESLDDLIAQGWEFELDRIEQQHLGRQGESSRIAATIKIEQFLDLNHRLTEVTLGGDVHHAYVSVVRELRAEGIEISDRRVVKGLKLIAGAALLRESDMIEVQDFWPLNYFWSKTEESETAQAIIQPRVEEAGGAVMTIVRPVLEILEDIEVLEGQESYIHNDVALGAHLMALNKVRREIIKDHRDDQDLRRRIDSVIKQNLLRMEKIHHV